VMLGGSVVLLAETVYQTMRKRLVRRIFHLLVQHGFQERQADRDG